MTQRQSQVNPSTEFIPSAVEGLRTGLLTISEFAQVCRTTPRTIRFYDQKGLLKPFRVDPWNKYRYYKAEQARDFFKLTLIHNFGLTLSQVKDVKSKNRLNLPLTQRLKRLKEEIDERKKEHTFLTHMQRFMFGSRDVGRDLKTDYFASSSLFCTRVENCRYDQINSVIYTLKGEAKRLKIPVIDEQMVFYLEEGYHPQGTKLEIGLICKQNVNPSEYTLSNGNYFKTYPKTKALTYTYTGPFQYLTFMHKKLQEYVYAKKLLRGFIFDLHKRGPWNSKLEYDHVTILGFPC